jgi:hypothetical protein
MIKFLRLKCHPENQAPTLKGGFSKLSIQWRKDIPLGIEGARRGYMKIND